MLETFLNSCKPRRVLRTPTPPTGIIPSNSGRLDQAPLGCSGRGDSYAYHLPQARLIAESGRLAVNEHLAHPLRPHYYHLLCASALLLWDDRLANVIHTASAILSVFGVFWLGRIWFGPLAAFLACAMYVPFVLSIQFSTSLVTTAWVGFGTAVFTPFACHCLAGPSPTQTAACCAWRVC